MNEKTISVIIPCYNGAEFLPESIESILAQSYQHFEIIAVDDGSTDKTSKVIASYPNVRYIWQINQGVAVARNVGLRESRGDYSVFLDQDDRLLSNAFDVGLNCLNSHPECGFVFGLFRFIGSDGKPLRQISQWQKRTKVRSKQPAKMIEQNIESTKYQEHIGYQTLLSGRTISTPSTAMFRRSVFKSVGDFDPSVVPMDDYDIYLRIARKFPVYCHNQIIVEYRRHCKNQSRRNNARELVSTLCVLDAQKEFVKKNVKYKKAYRIGIKRWKRQWGRWLPYDVAHNLMAGRFSYAVRCTFLLIRHYPQGMLWFPVHLLSRLAKCCKSST